ncbi:MAG: TrkA family potassium uptake protein, partial [Pyrinomonadaceae bacterium]|nr:TrkA family potassium uptake protein [Pyrinomonadaceae bacterium]
MIMNRFAVLGLGNFGRHVARTLYEANKTVIAIDSNSEVVQELAEYATQAVVADVTERASLESLGVGDVDAAIVSLGARMDLSTLAVLHLKEMGVPFIAVKAL